MHIGFITSEFHHEKLDIPLGGIGTFTSNISKSLIKKGHQVSVFIPSQSKNEIFKEGNLTIHLIKKKSLKGLTWLVNRLSFNGYVNKRIESDHIDLIESPEWSGFTAFMNFKCPIILRLHGSDTYFCHLEKRKVKFKNRYYEKNALKRADYIVGVSKFVAETTNKLFSMNRKIDVIYNGISVVDFSPDHTNIKPKSILFFGTIIRKKGVIALVKIFNELVLVDKEVTLTLLGRDSHDIITKRQTLDICLELMSEEAKNRFEYKREVPYEEVQQELKKADIIALPSYAEAFPLTWLEAMALEKKLITSNIGWAKELMIDEVTGYTVDPDNSMDFLDKTLRLLQNSEDNQSMGIEARKRIVSMFSQEQLIDQNISYYNSLISDL